MKNILIHTLKDIKKNINSIVIFIGQYSIFIFYILFSIFFLIENHLYGEQIKQLSNYNIINFNTYYNDGRSGTTKNMHNTLEEILDKKQTAYTFIENIELEQYKNIDVVVGLGDFGKVFNIHNNTGESTVMIGSEVSKLEVGQTFKFGLRGQTELKVESKLPKNSSYLRKQQNVNLDNSILILTSFKVINENYYNNYIDPIITNISLVNPTDDELMTFTKTMSDSKAYTLSPYRINEIAPPYYEKTKQNNLFFSIFFIFTIAFVSIGIVSSLLNLIDKNIKEYSIHLLYGATLKDIYLRVLFYILFLVTVPIIFSYSLIKLIQIPYISFTIVIMFGLLIVLFLSVVPLIKLKRVDMNYYLRRDI